MRTRDRHDGQNEWPLRTRRKRLHQTASGHEYGYEYSRLAQQVLANKQAFYLSIYQHHNTRHFGTGIKDRADCQKAKWAINAAWLHQALAIITSARNKIQKETKIKSLNLKPGDAG